MGKQRFRALVLVLFLFTEGMASQSGGIDSASEYSVSPLEEGGMSKDAYYDSLGIPDLSVRTKCRKNCSDHCCYSVLVDAAGRIMRSFSASDDVSVVARNRYKERSFLLVKHGYDTGRGQTSVWELYDDRLRSYPVPPHIEGAAATAVTREGDIVQISDTGVYRNHRRLLPLYEGAQIESARIENNPDGILGAAVIDAKSRGVWVTNLKRWLHSTIVLAEHSDKDDVLALCPADGKTVYVVAYNLVNVFDKGLVGAEVDFESGRAQSAWLYDSETRNVGFSPQIYLAGNRLYIYAKDSTHDRRVHLTVEKNGIKTAQYHETAGENVADFMGGVGTAYLGWSAGSSVEKGSTVYADTDYEISNSLYKMLYFQGRIYRTRLALSYMKNEAEKAGELTKRASEILQFLVDFDALIPGSISLRLAFTKGEVNGVATFIDKQNGGTPVTPDGTKEEFASTVNRYSLLFMMEKGMYWGADFSTYKTPSAVGFSDSGKSIAYYGLDKAFRMDNYTARIGYDTAAYARRYEADYSTFFFQGFIGGGLSVYTLSGDFKQHVETVSGKKIRTDNTFSLLLDAQLQAGYLWQQRFRSIKGLGYSVEVGVKARGTYTGVGQSDSGGSVGDDELRLEMQRYDVWYGPYGYVNLVF